MIQIYTPTFDDINDYLIDIKSDSTKILFERYRNEEKESDIDEEEEYLKLEASAVQNPIYLECSKIINVKNKNYVILRYFNNYNALNNHVAHKHQNKNKNKLIINIDYVNQNILLCERENKKISF